MLGVGLCGGAKGNGCSCVLLTRLVFFFVFFSETIKLSVLSHEIPSFIFPEQ